MVYIYIYMQDNLKKSASPQPPGTGAMRSWEFPLGRTMPMPTQIGAFFVRAVSDTSPGPTSYYQSFSGGKSG